METLQNSSTNLYKLLCDAEVFVPLDYDCVEVLLKRIKEADNNNREYLLDINPTLDCNFRCWYCYENHVKDSLMKPEMVQQVKNLISDIVRHESIEVLNLGFFGGEPLIGFHQVCKPLIQHAAGECQRHGQHLNIHFTTNGGLLDNGIVEFLADYDCSMQITLDGGKERHDKIRFFKGGIGSYDKIIDGIKQLLKHKIVVTLRINYDSNNIDSVESLIRDMDVLTDELRQYIIVDFQRVWQDRDNSVDATEEKAMKLRDRCRRNRIPVANHFIHRDVRQSCYADKVNHALVNYDGYVFACTARDFTPESAIGQLAPNGTIEYYPESITVRGSAKLAKRVCQKCRIAPICGGGCSQKSVEGLKHDRCNLGYSELDKDKIILDLFQYTIMREYPS